MNSHLALGVLAKRLEQLLATKGCLAAVRAAIASEVGQDLESFRQSMRALGEPRFELPPRPRAEQVAARRALERAWQSIGSPPPGEWRGSLAHTAGAALAAAWRSSRLIGIDLERADRSVSEAVRTRTAHPEDRVEGLPSIALWAAKEALYKAGAAERFAEMCVQFAKGAPDGHGKARGMDYRLALAIEDEWLAVAAVEEG